MKNENRASRKGSVFWSNTKTPRSDAPARAQGLRKRSFEIIRKPDLIGSSFLFNNVRVAYVATCPETNISFYVNNGQGGVVGVSVYPNGQGGVVGVSVYPNGQGGVVGVRVYPDGRKVLVNATTSTNENSRTDYDAKRKQRYLQFKNAFGRGKHILASHAVYMAWRNKEIPAGMTIDHINGCTTNNDVRNLRCVSGAINSRDGGFLRKLRNKGINPGTSSRQTGGVASAEKGTCIPRWMLLRYFGRMAHIKANISSRRYNHLDRADLMTILFYDLPVVYNHFKREYNIELPFKMGLL